MQYRGFVGAPVFCRPQKKNETWMHLSACVRTGRQDRPDNIKSPLVILAADVQPFDVHRSIRAKIRHFRNILYVEQVLIRLRVVLFVPSISVLMGYFFGISRESVTVFGRLKTSGAPYRQHTGLAGFQGF